MKRISLRSFGLTLGLVISISATLALSSCAQKRDQAQNQENKPVHAEQASNAKVGKTYTCPMHPEVVQDKPGNCPKCGMTLVAK